MVSHKSFWDLKVIPILVYHLVNTHGSTGTLGFIIYQSFDTSVVLISSLRLYNRSGSPSVRFMWSTCSCQFTSFDKWESSTYFHYMNNLLCFVFAVRWSRAEKGNGQELPWALHTLLRTLGYKWICESLVLESKYFVHLSWIRRLLHIAVGHHRSCRISIFL